MMNTTFTIEVRREMRFTNHEEFGRVCEIIEELANSWSDAIFDNWDISGDWDKVGRYIRYPNVILYAEGRETTLQGNAQDQDVVYMEYNEVNDILNRCVNQVLAALSNGA